MTCLTNAAKRKRERIKNRLPFLLKNYLPFLFFTHFIQKPDFGIVKLLGEVNIYLVRIDKASRFVPEGIKLFFADIADFHYAGRGIAAYTVLENRNHKLSECISTARKLGFFPWLYRVKQPHGFGSIKLFVSQTD